MKARIYIDDPYEAPEDANVQQGQQGGLYYETGSDESDETDGAEDDEAEGDETESNETEDSNEEDESVDDRLKQLPKSDKVEQNTTEFGGTLDAIHGYKFETDVHKRINEYLRGGETENPRAERQANLIQRAIDEAPSFDEPKQVYRAIKLDGDEYDEFMDRLEGSDEIELEGLTSTSHDPNYIRAFTGGGPWADEDERSLVFNIETEEGLPIYGVESDETRSVRGEEISYPLSEENNEEEEVLLGHNWTYEVESVERVDDGAMANLKVVEQ